MFAIHSHCLTMPALSSSFFKLFGMNLSSRNGPLMLSRVNRFQRNYADTPKVETSSKQMVVQGNENEERVRVRRARPADVPRVLRFVREHARSAWPGLILQPPVSHVVLCDYVARALAQGHSMLAEQLEARRGWTQIRGLALSTAVCPWDAAALDKWAQCVRCTRSRRMMHFTAHCLRAPALHDKYRVHNILQVILIVPKDHPKQAEIIQVLAKNAIQRGRDVGYPVIRFDVTAENTAKTLEELKLKKEWQLTFNVSQSNLKAAPVKEIEAEEDEKEEAEPDIDSEKPKSNEIKNEDPKSENVKLVDGNFVAVYSAMTICANQREFDKKS